MDDNHAIAQYQAGDVDAFRHLVERYQAEAFGHALVILGSREEAADAVQEAFLRAFRALDRFQPGRRFYPWFYTILRHGCLKRVHLRAREAHGQAETGQAWLEPAQTNLFPYSSEQLEKALFALQPEDRELITLKHLDGLSYEELAQRLEIPPGTVMSRLSHARQRLREALKKQAEEQG